MSKLENWKNSATKRAEFAAILQEPIMQEAIEVVKEAIFLPTPLPQGLSPADRMALMGEMGLRREMGLEWLHKFTSLANIQANRAKAQTLQKRKPWETTDREAGERKLHDEFFGTAPAAATGDTGGAPPAEQETPPPPPSTPQ